MSHVTAHSGALPGDPWVGVSSGTWSQVWPQVCVRGHVALLTFWPTLLQWSKCQKMRMRLEHMVRRVSDWDWSHWCVCVCCVALHTDSVWSVSSVWLLTYGFFDHAELDLMCQEYFGVSLGITLHCFLIPGLLCAGWAGRRGRGARLGDGSVCAGGCCELRLLR